MGAINRAKTQAGGTVGRHVTSLTIAAPEKVMAVFKKAEADLLAATRVLSLKTLAVGEGPEFELGSLVKDIELAPVPTQG